MRPQRAGSACTAYPPSLPLIPLNHQPSRQVNGDLPIEDAGHRQPLQEACRPHHRAAFERAHGHGWWDAEVTDSTRSAFVSARRPRARTGLRVAPRMRRHCCCERCACETCREPPRGTAAQRAGGCPRAARQTQRHAPSERAAARSLPRAPRDGRSAKAPAAPSSPPPSAPTAVPPAPAHVCLACALATASAPSPPATPIVPSVWTRAASHQRSSTCQRRAPPPLPRPYAIGPVAARLVEVRVHAHGRVH